MSKVPVGIVKCTNYSLESVRSSLEEIAANTNFPDVRDKYILLKPNVLSDAPAEKNITTNPVVVKAVIEMLKDRGAGKIIVGDSPGLPGPNFKPKNSGIYRVCEEEGVEWVDFSSKTIEKTISKIKVVQTAYLEEVDMVFSLSKMKTHQLMGATGAVKNMFGTVPGLNKSPLHLKAPSPLAFASLICDIYRTHIPEYSIMDAVVAMEGAGPANGTMRQLNLILGSSSAPALDKAEAVIMGYRPEDIPILFVLEKEEKGSTEGSYPLLDPCSLVQKDFRRVPMKKRSLFSALILPYLMRHREHKETRKRKAPVFLSEKCILCKRCIGICPAKALTIKEGKIEIDREKCIRCYCCHEVCPKNAIEVENHN